jgi:hypothetical protein
MVAQTARFLSRIAALCGLLAAGLCFFCSTDAEARPGMAARNPQARFEAMDADKDGKVSSEEFFAAHPQMKSAAFEALDADKDGFINAKEWEDFAVGHKADVKNSGTMPQGAGGPMGGMMGGAMPPRAAAVNGTAGQPVRPMPDLIMPPSAK